jgi:2-polyprenyl-3-methyl-5-hydroxy-6-metoxy-1,4-benzoquinol methylase
MSIHLGGDLYTRQPALDGRLRRILQIACDLAGQPLNQLRVLDLACLEGHYGIELALHGAEVVGIELREANLAKARYVKDYLRLDRLTLYQDDVRNLSLEKYGQFDLVICSGILYHLDVPDMFHLVRRIFEVCTRLAIIDTLIARHIMECGTRSTTNLPIAIRG